MMCRFGGIHAKFLRGDMKGTIAMTKETLEIVQNAVENELSTEMTDYYVEMLERTLMEVTNSMFGCTAERLFTLAYTNKLYM